MATLTLVSPSIAGAVVAPQASAPAGDVVPWDGKDLLLFCENGHSSAVTINIAPTQTTKRVEGVGPITVPTRSLELAQNEFGVIFIPREEAGAYVNSAVQIPLSYTGGNAAFLVTPMSV